MNNRKEGTADGSSAEDFFNELFRKLPAPKGSRASGGDQHGKTEHAGLEKMIRDTINAAVLDAGADLENEIYALQRTVDENYNLDAMGWDLLMREVSACKALLTEIRDVQVSGLENLIRETINAAVLDAAVTSEIKIDVLQRMVEESYKLLAAPLAWIVGEIFNNKALLMERYTRQSPGRRRCKVNMRKRRFGSTAQGGERG